MSFYFIDCFLHSTKRRKTIVCQVLRQYSEGQNIHGPWSHVAQSIVGKTVINEAGIGISKAQHSPR